MTVAAKSISILFGILLARLLIIERKASTGKDYESELI